MYKYIKNKKKCVSPKIEAKYNYPPLSDHLIARSTSPPSPNLT